MSDASPPHLDLRPLPMGELVDRSVGLWRRHAVAFFKLHLGFSLLHYALAKNLLLAIGRWAPLFRGGEAMNVAVASSSPALMAQLPAALGLYAAFLVAYTWVNWQSWVAISDYAVGAWLGRPVTVEGSLRRALRRAGPSSVAFAIAGLYAIAATIAFMLPGAGLLVLVLVVLPGPEVTAVLSVIAVLLATLGMVVAVLWCVLRFLLTCQVLATEDTGGLRAVRRSGVLISGRVGPGLLGWVKIRATVLVTVVALLVFTVMFVSGLPALVLQTTYGNLLDPARASLDAVPQALLVPAELFQVLAQSFFSPLYIAFAGLFYADMRVRREGLDLEIALDRELVPGREAAQ